MEQISMLERLSPQMLESLVREALDGAETELAQMGRIAAWPGRLATSRRDRAAPRAWTRCATRPRCAEALLVERNWRRWTLALTACFARERCFVVVGAAHLAGPDGLVATFAARGYKLTQR